MGVLDDDDGGGGGGNLPSFADASEEITFWRRQAQTFKQTLRDTESTLKDFEESSKELEREMEQELNAANSKMNELQVRSEKLKGDADEWKGKYQRTLTDHNKTLAELNRELTLLRESHNAYKSKLRNMEVDNDELEKTERIVAASLHDMESRYNRAIEHTALLEGELLAKTKLEEENQRLKDELRETRDELEIFQERLAHQQQQTRSDTRTSVDRNGSSNGRSSIDVDRPSNYRPSSHASGYDRPSSRASGVHSNPPPPSSSSGAAAATRRALMQSRSTFGSSADVRSPDRHVSGASANSYRPRQSIGPLSRPSTAGSSTMNRPSNRLSNVHGSGRVQQGSSMRKMAGLLQNLRELQATVYTATRMGPSEAQSSAIPRPSSRLSTSIGPGGNSTPRRSLDVRRDDFATPSAIPLPSTGLSRSISQRPSSRLSHQPSSVRSQTPNLENYASLDFLDRDPAEMDERQQQQQRRRSQLSSTTTGQAPTSHSLASSVRHNTETLSSARPRVNTLSSSLSGNKGSMLSASSYRDESLRRMVHPKTGRPVPPSTTLRYASMTPGKPRNHSIDSSGKAF